jgi:iron complex transport system substrate-binding protein
MTTRSPRRSLAAFSAALVLLLGAACGGASRGGPAPAGQEPPTGGQEGAPGTGTVAAAVFPVTLTDDAGRQVTVRQPPARIVSLAPSNTEVLFALGLGDRVAAVTTFCDYPEAAKGKPKVGGLRPNLEAIVALQPDLVLGIRGTPPDVIAALEGQQIPVAILTPPDFPAVLGSLRAVGRLTGASAAAEGVAAEMQRRWSAVEARTRTARARPRVLFEVDATDPAAVTAAGPGTFIDAMIVAGGGQNVLATLTPGQQYPRISAEAVLQADPDLILLGNAAFGQTRETVALRPGWSALRAVQQGAVAELGDPNLVSRPGPRLVEGLEEVARAIHPDLFGPLPARPTASPGPR